MSTDPRYTIFAARAVFDANLTPIDIRILAALGTYSDRQGWCYPAQSTLASRCNVARQSVVTSIKRLADLGYIQVTPQVTDKGRQINLYRVVMDLSAPESVLEIADPPQAQVIDFPDVQTVDSRLSTKQTGLDIVAVNSENPQDVDPPVHHLDSRLSTGVDSHIDNIPIKKDKKRATRLAATWAPRPEEISFGVGGGLSEPEVRAAADHMRDWAASSPKAVKLDWDRTFRNWLRTTISDARRGRRPIVSEASFDRAAALRIFREHGYRHPKLTDADVNTIDTACEAS